MIHFGDVHDISRMTERTMPVTVDPHSIKVLGRPLYWAYRQRLTSSASVVSKVCMVLLSWSGAQTGSGQTSRKLLSKSQVEARPRPAGLMGDKGQGRAGRAEN
jgi:hypothetical protein